MDQSHTIHDKSLIFLHGFLGGPEDWLPVIAHLPCHFHCEAVDLNAPDPQQHAKSFLEEKKGAPFFLVGYSMGGRLAWQLAPYFSASLSGLILLGAHPGLGCAAEKKARGESDQAWIDLLKKGDMSIFLKRWYAQPLFDSLRKNAVLFSRLLEQRMKRDPHLLAEILRSTSLARQPQQSIYSPSLFLHGAQDLKYANIYSDLAHIEAIPEAGHAAHVENPRAVADAIQRFIESRS